MSKKIRDTPRSQPRPSRVRRSATTFAAASGLSLVLAACGSPSVGVAHLGLTTTTQASSSASHAASLVAEALAFARCMRAHDVTNFPDPNANGDFAKATMGQLAANDSHYQRASQACVHLFPGISGKSPSQLLDQVIANDEAKFVRCMRTHGVPKWPNPVLQQGRLVFDSSAVGIDPSTPKIAATMRTCDDVFPASVGVPPGAGQNPNS